MLDLDTAEQNVSEVPDTDELCRQVDEVLDQTQNQRQPLQVVTNPGGVLTTSEGVAHMPPPIFCPYQPLVMTSTKIIQQMQDRTMSVDHFMNIRFHEEKWKDSHQLTFKEVLDKPARKPVLMPQMEDIVERYGDREWQQRKDRLLSCDESQKIVFVDSHFHLNKIRAVVGFSALQSILNNGPMPQTPVRLQHAVCNFCHGVPGHEEMIICKQVVDDVVRQLPMTKYSGNGFSIFKSSVQH